MYEKVFLNKYGFYELKNKEIMRTHIAKKKRNFLTIKCDKKE